MIKIQSKLSKRYALVMYVTWIVNHGDFTTIVGVYAVAFKRSHYIDNVQFYIDSGITILCINIRHFMYFLLKI